MMLHEFFFFASKLEPPPQFPDRLIPLLHRGVPVGCDLAEVVLPDGAEVHEIGLAHEKYVPQMTCSQSLPGTYLMRMPLK